MINIDHCAMNLLSTISLAWCCSQHWHHLDIADHDVFDGDLADHFVKEDDLVVVHKSNIDDDQAKCSILTLLTTNHGVDYDDQHQDDANVYDNIYDDLARWSTLASSSSTTLTMIGQY